LIAHTSKKSEKYSSLKEQLDRIESEQSDLISHLIKQKSSLSQQVESLSEKEKYFQESLQLRAAMDYDER